MKTYDIPDFLRNHENLRMERKMSSKITDEQIDEAIEKLRIAFGAPTKEAFISALANRFLNWRLPAGFNPDGGVSFTRTRNGYVDGKFVKDIVLTPDDSSWPMGTNLFDHDQAKQMVRHMLKSGD